MYNKFLIDENVLKKTKYLWVLNLQLSEKNLNDYVTIVGFTFDILQMQKCLLTLHWINWKRPVVSIYLLIE